MDRFNSRLMYNQCTMNAVLKATTLQECKRARVLRTADRQDSQGKPRSGVGKGEEKVLPKQEVL